MMELVNILKETLEVLEKTLDYLYDKEEDPAEYTQIQRLYEKVKELQTQCEFIPMV